eukprot:613117-Pleurochrysis_carterae.AAC.1
MPSAALACSPNESGRGEVSILPAARIFLKAARSVMPCALPPFACASLRGAGCALCSGESRQHAMLHGFAVRPTALRCSCCKAFFACPCSLPPARERFLPLPAASCAAVKRGAFDCAQALRACSSSSSC